MKNNVAKNIQTFRNVNGLTLEQLSEKTGIDPKTLNKYEKGITEPNATKLIALARVFNIDLSTLITAEVELTVKYIPTKR
jgi:transcriptional regulator with XRE-family HTH domain